MAGPSDFMQRLPEVKLFHAFLATQKGPEGPFCAGVESLIADGRAW